jgi:endonuclease/exonuclease/phosphatase (EEP) superfamily protein YafD
MKTTIIKTLIRIAFIANIGLIILLLLSNLAPLLNPAKYWPIALLGITFPILLIFTICFIIFWLFVKRKKSFFSIAAIFLSLPNIFSCFAFHFQPGFTQQKQNQNLRVLTWNVGLMNYEVADSTIAIENNKIIFAKIKEADADIVCLQEFFSAIVPGNHYNLIDSISKTINYPYTYFSKDIPKFDGKYYSGTIIFSRYKFIDTQKIVYPNSFGSILKAAIYFNHDTTNIFTTRFQSVNFRKNEYRELNNIKKVSDSAFAGSKNIAKKLILGYSQRVQQISIAKQFMADQKRPVIFTGDFNDVPTSYTYSTLKKGMSDVWISKGAGLGRTFEFISPTLRIDNIFYNDFFKAQQVKRIITKGASDHYGILADFSLIKNEQ